MPEKAPPAPAIPAHYRLALALSLAFMAHTLLLAGLPAPLQEVREVSHRVVFRLASAPSEATRASTPASSSAQPPRHPEFEVPATPEAVTTTAPSRPAANPKPDPEPALEAPEPTPQPAPRPEPAPAPASTPSIESAPRTGEPESADTIARITDSPAERDPYLILLATHLAEQLDQQRVPAISQLGEQVSMELELTLLPNGALTRARVIRSTGIQRIDEAAYRAALAASPYPEPKGEESDRFEVKLVFTPKRT